MISFSQLPALNAFLNGTSAAFLASGFFFIRKENIKLHTLFMSLAFLTSTVFLVSYLTYHYVHGATRFAGTGWARPFYFGILISHTLLAVVIVPLSLRTFYLAFKRRFEAHKKIARWALPLWLYVSVTGVLVYLMLYQAPFARACPACKELASPGEGGMSLAKGFNLSIALMATTPYLLFAGITYLIVRSARKNKS